MQELNGPNSHMALGAFALRSAGCVYNDIVDRDLDRQVERTRLRPLASGRVSTAAAWAFLVGLSLVGLAVWTAAAVGLGWWTTRRRDIT
jgi:4-hydroxybenzoate polyprenyltransferase